MLPCNLTVILVNSLNFIIVVKRKETLNIERQESPLGTHSRAKQSSAELMAASSYPSHPYKSELRPPPPSTLTLFCLESRSLATKESFHMETVLMEAGRGMFFSEEMEGVSSRGGSMGSMLKPIFVWENGALPLTGSSHT